MSTTRDPDRRHAIVVGVDPSPAGRLAAGWAARQAHLENRPVVLVRAAGSPAEGESVLAAATEQLRRVHPDLDIRSVVVPDEATPELHRMTADAHLVVLGSDGHGLIHHRTPWHVGPTLARKAGCPVVVVPRHTHTVRHGVLVGVDLSTRSSAVLRVGFGLASTRGLPLVAMHVTRETQADRVADAERALAETVSGFLEEFPDVPVRLEVTQGWAAGRLVERSASMHLLVVGRHHRPGPFGSPLGHVRSGVVARAGCPVAVVPTDAEESVRA
jgi:nucleotide-binding universal stress UspA family protein